MGKCFALMALLLFFLPKQSQAQKYGNGERFTVAPPDIPVLDPLQVFNTLRPRLGWTDTLPKNFLPKPVLAPSLQQGTGKKTNGLFPEPVIPGQPINLPKQPSVGDIGTYTKMERGAGIGDKTVPSETMIMEGLKEGLKFPGPGLIHDMPAIPDTDQIKKEIPGLRTGSNAFVKDVMPGEPFRLLPGKVVPDTVFHVMDSVRKAAHSRKDLLQREAQLGEGLKKVAFSNKPKFWDRTYLEGIIGLDPGTARIQNISPALGYYLHPKMSLGLGPNINFGNPKDVLMSAVGTRSFLKYELLRRKAYLQAENLSHLNKIKNPAQEKAGYGKIDHSLSLGAGYLLSISNALSLNVMMLYNVNRSTLPDRQTSSFNVRLGMSSFKPIE